MTSSKPVTFVIFLVAYVVYLTLATFLSPRLTRASTAGDSARTNEYGVLLSLLANVSILIFIYVLSGYFNLQLTVIFLGSTLISFALTLLVQPLMGRQTREMLMYRFWIGAETAQHKFITLTLRFVQVSVFLYPVIVGVLFFTNNDSDTFTLTTVRVTLLMLGLVGYTITLPVVALSLASRNMNDHLRDRILIEYLANLLQTGIFLGFVIWTFGVGGASNQLQLVGVNIFVSPVLFVTLIIYFVLFLLFPYLIGIRRYRGRQIAYANQQIAALEDLVEQLPIRDGSPDPAPLQTSTTRINDALNQLFQDEPMIAEALSSASATEPLADDVRRVVEAYNQSRDLDPRYRHALWLANRLGDVAAIIDVLKTEPAASARRDEARYWAESYRQNQDDVGKRLDSFKTNRHFVYALALAAFSFVSSFLISHLTELAWTTLLQSLPH